MKIKMLKDNAAIGWPAKKDEVAEVADLCMIQQLVAGGFAEIVRPEKPAEKPKTPAK